MLINMEQIYKSRWLHIVKDSAGYEIVRIPRVAVCIPTPEPGKVYLVRQFRPPVGQDLWELPAGRVEPGETPTEAALRECIEEVGLEATEIRPRGRFYSTPGFSDEELHFFQLSRLTAPLNPRPQDTGEQAVPILWDLTQALRAISLGEIRDLKTVVGIQMLVS